MGLLERLIEKRDAIKQKLAEVYSEGLAMYRPMESQVPIHLSLAKKIVIRGGNQSGKSACTAAEIASAALHQPIILPNGQLSPLKHSQKRGLMIWVIGFGWEHVGDTLHRLLFTEDHGLEMIRDLKTGEYRSWRPWEASDKAREDETKPMPPFIPERMFAKEPAWEDKGKKAFSRVELKNGTTIRAFSSKAEMAKQGDQVDIVWVDEDVYYARHITEWLARLSRRKGRMLWSAYPHNANEALMNMSERATIDRELGVKPPSVFEVVLRFRDNPFMPDTEKAERLRDWEAAGEVDGRDLGMYQTDNLLIYPTFDEQIHGIGPRVAVREKDKDYALCNLMKSRGYVPPENWTRYMIVDPGHTQAAALFAAVPPPEFGDYVVLYKELYPANKSVEQFADLIHKNIGGERFAEFIIDWQAARVSGIGGGARVIDRFVDSFAKLGIESDLTGNSFRRGSSNVWARIDKARSWLLLRDDGTCKIKICLPTMPNFLREIKLYQKKRGQMGQVLDEPRRKKDHLMNCFEYLAARGPEYIKAPPRSPVLGPVFAAFLKENGRTDDQKQFHCGPGVP